MTRKERTIVVAIVVNALLILFKFWLASASGSLALRSSALHSIADLAIGVFVLLSLFVSRLEEAKHRERRTIGLVENWAALAVSAAIFYVGYDIVTEVLGGQAPELRNLVPITMAALITVAVAYVIARYKLYVGRQTNSPVLIASGRHSQIDIYASIVVVIGLAGAAMGLPNLDTAAAAVIAVLIFLSGYQIAASALTALVRGHQIDFDESSDTEAPSGRSWWRVYGAAGGVLLVGLYLLSGFYTVQPGENAVVRRFGQVVEQASPGLHYRWPTPIERVDVVSVENIRRLEMRPTQILTGDENLIAVRASVHFSVDTATAFILNVADPERLVEQTTTAALREVVAREAVDALLTVDKDKIEKQTADRARALLSQNDVGVRIIGVQLLESAPPPEVTQSFRDVASAREDRNTFVNEALAYQNEIIPVARGEAEKIRQTANAYAIEEQGMATGEATSFVARQSAYTSAPEITRQRLYLEAIETSLPGARKFVIDPAVSPQSTDLWIPRSANNTPSQ